MPIESVLDTMLHELCHNVIGPHNKAFHNLWDELRAEWETLMIKGFTGEHFLNEGRRLGGSSRLTPDEARRQARQAAEARRNKQDTAGQRLGGKVPRPGQDIRKVIADAAQRRAAISKGCASESMNDQQICDVADTATRNGFRTKAEEDEANEAAIAQALHELAEEDGRRGLRGSSATGSSSGYGQGSNGGKASSSSAPLGTFDGMWICGVCTLQNPQNFLACDACGSECTALPVEKMPQQSAKKRLEAPGTQEGAREHTKGPEVVDLTVSPPRKRDEKRRRRDGPTYSPEPYVAPFWNCTECGTKMERRWWTCSTCGHVKESS